MFRRVRQSRSQRLSDTADRKRAGSEDEIVVFHMFLLLSERKRVLTSPGEEIGTKMASSQVSCHWTMSLDRTSAQWIGHHSFGPYTYKLGVDRPTRSLKRFSVSRPLFALRVFLKGAICGVLGEFLVPIFPSYRGV